MNGKSTNTLLKVLAALLSAGLLLGLVVPAMGRAETNGYSVAISDAKSAPTHSTLEYTISINCVVQGGCAGASLTLNRPTGPDGVKLDGPAVFSLRSGVNPAIVFTTTGDNTDTVTMDFSRFDQNISQVFTVSWKTTDALVIPGTYTLNWSTKWPAQGVDRTGSATGVVTGTPNVSLQKSAVTGGNTTWAGQFRRYQIQYNRPRNVGTTGVTTTLVDKLPPEVEFLGFTEEGVGGDMRFRRLDIANGDTKTVYDTTESGGAIYEYDAANHQVLIHITRGVDAYLGMRTRGMAIIRYDVRTKQQNASGQPIAAGTPVKNTVSALDPTTLDGKSFAIAPATASATYIAQRPGTFTKGRTTGEYVRTTADDPNAPAQRFGWAIGTTNPGTAPTQLRIVDKTRWEKPIQGTDYRYLTAVSLDPVTYNNGDVISYPATVIGTTASGNTITYTVGAGQTLNIPASDEIINAEIVVENFRNMDLVPDTPTNGLLNVRLTHDVKITTQQIVDAKNAPGMFLFNEATFILNNKGAGFARAYYTLQAILPAINPLLEGVPKPGNTRDGIGLYRNETFTAQMNLYATQAGVMAHPEAFMVLPKGFTLGGTPQLTNAPGKSCTPDASEWVWEKMAPYNGGERWRITLRDGGELDPKNGAAQLCYNLEVSSGNAMAGTYDKPNLNDPMHGIVLGVREMGGALASTQMGSNDAYDINSDGNTEGQWRFTSMPVSVAPISAVGVTKTSQGDLDKVNDISPQQWEPGATTAAQARDTADFTITASTSGTTAVRDLVVYDMLPTVGESFTQMVDNATADPAANTVNTFGPTLTGPVTRVGHSEDVTVYYTTSANPCRPELSTSRQWPTTDCTSFNAKNEWTTNFDSLRKEDIKGIRIVFNQPVFGDFSFNVPVALPKNDYSGKPVDDADIATNRTAVAAKTPDGVVIPYVGPAFARVTPYGAIGVNKSTIINGKFSDTAGDTAAPTLRRGDEFIWVVNAYGDKDGVATTDPEIYDELPAGVELVEVVKDAPYASDGTFDEENGLWKPGRIDPGQHKYLYLKVRATGAGDMSNYALYDDPSEPGLPDQNQCVAGVDNDGKRACDVSTVHIDAGNATISGNVFNDVDWSNTRTDGDGANDNWPVYLMEVLEDGTLKPIAETFTNVDGNYTFDSLPAGNYRVAFGAEDRVRFADSNIGDDEQADSDGEEYLEIDGNPRFLTASYALAESSSIDNIDLGVQELAYVSGIAFDDRDGNGSMDGEDTALSGVEVQIFNEDGTPALAGYSPSNPTGAEAPTLTTGEDGTYRFEGLRPGRYYVQFSEKDNYAFTIQSGAADTISEPEKSDVIQFGETAGQTPVFGAVIGETPNVDAGQVQRAQLAGVVWTDDNGDGFNSEGENPREGVVVQLVDANGNVVETTTNGNGEYSFTGILPGTYTVVFNAGDDIVFTTRPETPNASDVDGSDVDSATGRFENLVLTPGANVGHLDAGVLPRSTVSGAVFFDDNNNGMWDDDESVEPREVTVQLLDSEGNFVAETKTNPATGTYSFPNVVPGTYSVQFVNPNAGRFANPGDADSITDPRVNDADATGTTAQFVVAGGKAVEKVDAGFLRYQQVSGHVFEDTNANGVWDEGEPARKDVTVTLTDAQGTEHVQMTNDDGFYLFDGVMPGQTTVTFTLPDGTQWTTRTNSSTQLDDLRRDKLSDIDPETGAVTFTMVGFDDPANADSANVVNLDAGLIRPSVVAGVAFTDSNRDGRRDEDEAVLAGVTATLFRADGTQVGDSVTTNENGRYEFTDVVPGEYYVVFGPPEGAVFSPQAPAEDVLLPGLNDADGQGRTAIFTAGNNPVDTIDVGIINSANISGVAWIDKNQDGIRGDDEEVRSGVPVYLVDENGNVVGEPVFTNGDGAYAFIGVAPGTYSVVVGDPAKSIAERSAELGLGIGSPQTGEPFDAEKLNDVDPTTWTSRPFRLNAGADVVNVDIATTNLASVKGEVFLDLNRDGIQDSGETPVANAEVRIIDVESNQVYTTTTDETGAYSKAVPSDRTYRVEFPALEGYKFSPSNDWNRDVREAGFSDINDQGVTGEFTVGDGEEVGPISAGYIANGAISGIAFNDVDGNGTQDAGDEPRAGVNVELIRIAEDGTETVVDTVTTDENGAYLFNTVEPGTYAVRFSTGDEKLDFTQSDDATDQNLQESGRSDVNTSGMTRPFTIAVGDIVANVDAGVAAVPEPTTTPTTPVGEGTIAGRIFNDDNRNGAIDGIDSGIAGIVIELLDANGDPVLGTDGQPVTATTNAQGEYSFNNLPVGDYRVRVQSAPAGMELTSSYGGDGPTVNPSLVAPVTLTTSGVGGVNFGFSAPLIQPIPGPGSISGTVFVDKTALGEMGTDEYGIGGVIVILRDAFGAEVARTVTDREGRYVFTGLPAGSYVVEIDTDSSPLGTAFTLVSGPKGATGAAAVPRFEVELVEIADVDGTLIVDSVEGINFGFQPTAGPVEPATPTETTTETTTETATETESSAVTVTKEPSSGPTTTVTAAAPTTARSDNPTPSAPALTAAAPTASAAPAPAEDRARSRGLAETGANVLLVVLVGLVLLGAGAALVTRRRKDNN
ncbi:SdrD B-like domain-containing protein [Corynebacterium sp. LK2510]|uniref:SdrD B-like domain-containing protein n=1 Tax=Corynebacterium sp. LK2510 TaxID=3110472 RepID=UPI0034CD2F4F